MGFGRTHAGDVPPDRAHVSHGRFGQGPSEFEPDSRKAARETHMLDAGRLQLEFDDVDGVLHRGGKDPTSSGITFHEPWSENDPRDDAAARGLLEPLAGLGPAGCVHQRADHDVAELDGGFGEFQRAVGGLVTAVRTAVRQVRSNPEPLDPANDGLP